MQNAHVSYRLTNGEYGEMDVRARNLRAAIELVQDILYAQMLRTQTVEAVWTEE